MGRKSLMDIRHAVSWDFEQILKEVIVDKEPPITYPFVRVLSNAEMVHLEVERYEALEMARDIDAASPQQGADFASTEILNCGEERVFNTYNAQLEVHLPASNNPASVPLVSEKARELMRAMVNSCINLHNKQNLGLKKIEAKYLLMREKDSYIYIRCFHRELLQSLGDNESVKRERGWESFGHLKDFFENELFGSAYFAPKESVGSSSSQMTNRVPEDLIDFLTPLKKPDPDEIDFIDFNSRCKHIEDHVVLKDGMECVVYLKTILDRARGVRHAGLDMDWRFLLDELNEMDEFKNWLETIKGKPRCMWNFTLVKRGMVKEEFTSSLCYLITHLCDSFTMSYEEVYLVIVEAFPQLVHTLQRKLYKNPELLAYLRS